ncbi:MAG: D-2-hydroxyacid dehydrogenase family protein [Beijerinckiaceae bacterium]
MSDKANALPRIAVLNDSQNIAATSADWSTLKGRADVTIMREPFASEAAAIKALKDFDIIVPMRERTPFTASLLAGLPKLRMIALTGVRAATLDQATCDARKILVCNTGGEHVSPATAELAFGLILACARRIPQADAAMRTAGWHEGLDMGFSLAGKTLGIVGLGKLGARVAGYGRAFGMNVIAWSQNLTAEAASAAGAELVSKETLFQKADVVSLHLVLSARTRGIVGKTELDLMKPGAIIVNTARGPLIDEQALLTKLGTGSLYAGLDVFDTEPLPEKHPLRQIPNVVLTPHLGYSTQAVFRQFYGESLENILAFLNGTPKRVINPVVLTA